MNKLQELRKSKGDTQKTLAELLGVSEMTISRWEKEKELKIKYGKKGKNKGKNTGNGSRASNNLKTSSHKNAGMLQTSKAYLQKVFGTRR